MDQTQCPVPHPHGYSPGLRWCRCCSVRVILLLLIDICLLYIDSRFQWPYPTQMYLVELSYQRTCHWTCYFQTGTLLPQQWIFVSVLPVVSGLESSIRLTSCRREQPFHKGRFRVLDHSCFRTLCWNMNYIISWNKLINITFICSLIHSNMCGKRGDEYCSLIFTFVRSFFHFH